MTTCLGQLNSWEGVTISGLSTGNHQFNYIAVPNSSAHWDDWGDIASIPILLQSQDIGGGDDTGNVPEPESLALLGIGLLGFTFSQRKKRG